MAKARYAGYRGHTRYGKLRWVIERHPMFDAYGRFSHTFEVLECGHIYRARQDWHGETINERRRCWKCSGNYPADSLEKVVGEWVLTSHRPRPSDEGE